MVTGQSKRPIKGAMKTDTSQSADDSSAGSCETSLKSVTPANFSISSNPGPSSVLPSTVTCFSGSVFKSATVTPTFVPSGLIIWNRAVETAVGAVPAEFWGLERLM
jgi:hypothetical protein